MKSIENMDYEELFELCYDWSNHDAECFLDCSLKDNTPEHVRKAFAEMKKLQKEFEKQGLTVQLLLSIEVFVFPRLIKSPYKTYIQNIPLFMRVRKRFDAEKMLFLVVKKSMVLDRWVVDERLKGV